MMCAGRVTGECALVQASFRAIRSVWPLVFPPRLRNRIGINHVPATRTAQRWQGSKKIPVAIGDEGALFERSGWAGPITPFAPATHSMTFVGGNACAPHDLWSRARMYRPRMTYGPCPDTGALPIVVSGTQHSEYRSTTADGLRAEPVEGRTANRPSSQSTIEPIDHQAEECGVWGDPGAAGALRATSTGALQRAGERG